MQRPERIGASWAVTSLDLVDDRDDSFGA